MNLARMSLLAVGCCTLALLAVVLFGLWSFGQASQKQAELTEVLSFRESLDSLEGASTTFLHFDFDRSVISGYLRQFQSVQEKALQMVDRGPNYRRVYSQMTQLRSVIDQVLRDGESAEFEMPDSQQMMDRQGQLKRLVVNQVLEQWIAIDDAANDLVTVHLAELSSAAGRLILVFWVSTVLFGILCVAVAVLFYIKVVGPISGITRTIRSALEGDHSRRVPIDGNNELAVVGKAFNDLLDKTSDDQERFLSQQNILRKQAIRLRFAGEIAMLGGWSVDLNEDIWEWSVNACSVLGIGQHQGDDHLSQALSHCSEADRQRVKEAMRHCRSEGEEFDVNIVCNRSNGPRTVRMIGRRKDEGPNQYLQGIVQDIEDIKKLESELAQAQKLESVARLTNGVAHDFNNLLTIVLGNSEILLDDGISEDERKKIASVIAQAAEQGRDLVQSLIAFSRQQPLKERVVDLGELIKGLKSMLLVSLGRNIRLELNVGSAPNYVKIDKSQLEAVILNFAINSRDAMPAGGVFAISLKNEERLPESNNDATLTQSFVKIEVSDTGEGISEASITKIFDPFFTTKKANKGSGLGLAMVHGFVKQSGGEIDVRSAQGEGTVFTILLPRYEFRVRGSQIL